MTKAKTKRGSHRSAALSGEQLIDIAKALSDATRFAILQQIASGKRCSCAELRESTPVTAATLSHHLKELEAAGLILIARRGKFAYPFLRREVWDSYLSRLREL